MALGFNKRGSNSLLPVMLGALPISLYLIYQGWFTHQDGAIDCPFHSTYSCVYLVLICVQHCFNPKLYKAIIPKFTSKRIQFKRIKTQWKDKGIITFIKPYLLTTNSYWGRKIQFDIFIFFLHLSINTSLIIQNKL